MYLCDTINKHRIDAMKKLILSAAVLVTASVSCPAESFDPYAAEYTPSEAVLQSRREFAADRFGIFIHWGIYSMFAQGEWYLNYGPTHEEYSKAAGAFYPIRFDADAWAEAIRDSGARYICFTSRHHDGFSMYHTSE